MTRNRPQPARAVPARPMVCPCSSASTSFMLAALRVLHVDPSYAPAGIAWIKERPFLDPGTRSAATSVSHTQKQPDQEDEEAAARGVICVPTMSSNGIHTRSHARVSRPAEALLPNSPSCGNQPANISLTAPSRTDTHATSST